MGGMLEAMAGSVAGLLEEAPPGIQFDDVEPVLIDTDSTSAAIAASDQVRAGHE